MLGLEARPLSPEQAVLACFLISLGQRPCWLSASK